MKSVKILSAIAVILMLMNVFLLFQLMNRDGQQMMPPRPRHGAFKQEVIQTVGFDQEQAEAYDKLTVEHHIAMVRLEELRGEKLALLFSKLSGNETVDSASIYQDLEEIEKQRVAITYAHFEDVKALCKPEQLEAYDEVVKRAVQALLMPSPHRRRP